MRLRGQGRPVIVGVRHRLHAGLWLLFGGEAELGGRSGEAPWTTVEGGSEDAHDARSTFPGNSQLFGPTYRRSVGEVGRRTMKTFGVAD